MRMPVNEQHEVHVSTAEVKVATLGPEGTSSEEAARFFFLKAVGRPAAEGDVLLFSTYEEAKDAVLSDFASHLVVATAYPECHHFYMSGELIPDHENHFPRDTPPYLLVSRSRRCMLPRAVRIATHPAPAEVIDQLLATMADTFDWFKVVHSTSTAEAARMVAKDEVEVALTTDPARRRFGLVAISEESKTIPMDWLVFVKAA